ncbi:uncharacterized protein F5891DRAFT_977203 [Suillus fuscotomentosus]|uniref:Uncharacterized protein n=1 Tax=Suillus fuscotomentosus TaxID=1912939 RepID=A0AAD4EDP2_9AGAM|nr:uncharacterized protein F5891DRAFT_977203 [Suillus fuscotomentosus]KAG1904343.1 hypothetical protein F5891DRAFT_977203 [Suillus fuscotomentosus]
MPNEPLVNFTKHGHHFLVTNPDDVNEVRFVAREQLKVFILYSHALRNKAPSNRPDPPLGYEYFVWAYNHKGLASTATFINDQGVVKCEGSSIEMSDLLCDEDEDVTLSTSCMDQVDRMVWHTAVAAMRQHEKIEEHRMMNRKGKNFMKKHNSKVMKGLGGLNKNLSTTTSGSTPTGSSSSNLEPMNTSG